MQSITIHKNKVDSIDDQLSKKIDTLNITMNQFNTMTKELDNRYDILCAKETCTISFIDRPIQKFEERTDNLLATKMEKSERI